MKKAMLYKKGKKGEVNCLACNWYCKIAKGQTGICGVRENQNGDLYLLVYGRPYGWQIDPIEKKPLFHFLPGSKAFSLGTIGCNFACQFCQNWYESQLPREFKKKYGAKESLKPLRRLIEKFTAWPPKRIVDYCLKQQIPSIAYTYNEPAIFFEYAYDTAKLARKKGIKNVFVSNGFESKEALQLIKPYLDAINIDLKAYQARFYQKICAAKLAPVKENIKRVYKMGIWLEITTLIIPGENDSDEELTKIAKFIASVSPTIPWHVSQFHPDYLMLNKSVTPVETLERAYDIGKQAGLNYVYVGNIIDETRESTFCPGCGERLIGRLGYNIDINNKFAGTCPQCGKEINGVWS